MLLLLTLLATVSGCAPVATTGVEVMPPVNVVSPDGTISTVAGAGPQIPSDYRINPGDNLFIHFPKMAEYSDHHNVHIDGQISLPWLGSAQVAGKTLDELQAFLTESYDDLFRALPPPQARKYLIQVDDQMELRFPFNPELNVSTPVRPDGRISLPFVSSQIVAGKTPDEVETELAAQFKNYIKEPEMFLVVRPTTSAYWHEGKQKNLPSRNLSEVVVKMEQTIPLRLLVAGEVHDRGPLEYQGYMTAMQAIAAAGGVLPTGEMRSVIILRRGSGEQPLRIVLDLSEDLEGHSTQDIQLRPFDVVLVPQSRIAKFGDTVDQYIYRILRPLANSSVGFSYIKPVSTQKVDQTNRIRP